MAIVAVLEKNGRQEMLDVGKYIEDKNSAMSELVLVVGDDWRAKGLARFCRRAWSI
jgi:hypothetical protein